MPVVKTVQKHTLLLDTHVFLWLLHNEGGLSASFLKAVEHQQEKGQDILVSAITIWEIGILAEKKRIHLEMDCMEWVEKALAAPSIQLVPLTPKISIQSSRLPGNIHGDPADRILIATAHESNAVLVTCDKNILSYGKDNFVSVCNPRK